MNILIISRCIRNVGEHSILHYKGFLFDQKIRAIKILNLELVKGADYFINAVVVAIDGNQILEINVIDIKML